MLYNVLDAVLGSGAKVQILRALLPLRNAVTGREAQRLAGVRSDRGARQALRELAELGIVLREQSSASHLYRVNPKHELIPALTALFEAEAGRVQTLRQLLRAALKRAEVINRIESIILLPENTRNDAIPEGSTGILVVSGGEKAASKVRDALLVSGKKIFVSTGVRISPLVLSREAFRARSAEGDPLLKAAAARGQVLAGENLSELTGNR